MKALLVAICHEPEWLPNVQANVARQDAALPAAVVSNPNGAAAARNEALALATRAGFDALVLFDQDDHYGTGYVAEALAALDGVDFVGQPAGRVRLQSGELHTFHEHCWPFLGGTLAMRVARALDFQHRVPGTDFDWCERMAKAGRTYRRHAGSYTYQRRPGSVWHASDAVVRLSFGPSDHGPAPTMAEALESA